MTVQQKRLLSVSEKLVSSQTFYRLPKLVGGRPALAAHLAGEAGGYLAGGALHNPGVGNYVRFLCHGLPEAIHFPLLAINQGMWVLDS